MGKETIKTLQGDCYENEKNNEIGDPHNSIKKRNEGIINESIPNRKRYNDKRTC